MYGNKGNYRVYLKPLYSRLDRLAQSQSSPFSAEAQLEHVKILFIQISYSVSKKIRAETIGLKIFKIIDSGISFYCNNFDLLPPKPKFTFRRLKRGVQECHRRFVLAHVDKVANNVVVV